MKRTLLCRQVACAYTHTHGSEPDCTQSDDSRCVRACAFRGAPGRLARAQSGAGAGGDSWPLRPRLQCCDRPPHDTRCPPEKTRPAAQPADALPTPTPVAARRDAGRPRTPAPQPVSHASSSASPPLPPPPLPLPPPPQSILARQRGWPPALAQHPSPQLLSREMLIRQTSSPRWGSRATSVITLAVAV
ncbi:uncharacterized protein LOC126456395 [Schistocerca serialis cubense]|uniref:uncharacterized protein LOC126456395 n=1 Tax=Schistocerca serialis cubense TaxID=2023355 RepID=UPI00214F0FC7|nr:uncharacterized protein LOC126456395 [Schistocerca serialis cubense]